MIFFWLLPLLALALLALPKDSRPSCHSQFKSDPPWQIS